MKQAFQFFKSEQSAPKTVSMEPIEQGILKQLRVGWLIHSHSICTYPNGEVLVLVVFQREEDEP